MCYKFIFNSSTVAKRSELFTITTTTTTDDAGDAALLLLPTLDTHPTRRGRRRKMCENVADRGQWGRQTHTHTHWHTLVAQLVRRASAGDWIKDKVMYEFNALTYLAAAKVVYLWGRNMLPRILTGQIGSRQREVAAEERGEEGKKQQLSTSECLCQDLPMTAVEAAKNFFGNGILLFLRWHFACHYLCSRSLVSLSLSLTFPLLSLHCQLLSWAKWLCLFVVHTRIERNQILAQQIIWAPGLITFDMCTKQWQWQW